MRSKEPTPQPPTVAIAVFVGAVLVFAFFALISVVIPGAGQMLAAVILLSAFFVAQYFVWGRRLHRYVVEQERRREEAAARNRDPE